MADRPRPAWKRDPRKPQKKAAFRKVAAKLVEAKTALDALDSELGRTGLLKRLGPADFKPIIVKLIADHKPDVPIGTATEDLKPGVGGNMYLSLHTQDPGGPAPDEVSGGGYARLKVPPRPFIPKGRATDELGKAFDKALEGNLVKLLTKKLGVKDE